METYGSLTLSWAQSHPGKWINFISTDTLVYGGEGNVITVVRSSGEHCQSKPSLGAGVGPVICCAAYSIIAYAESTLKPKIFVVKFPSFELISTLEGGAVMGYNCLAFSSDGNYIASLSSLPDFHLTVWSCASGTVMAEAEVAHGSTQVSFNPINWKQLCVLGDSHVTLYLLEQCGPLTQLTAMEVPLPTRNGFVGCILQPPRSPVKQKRLSYVPPLDSRPTTAINQPPTDLSTILYSDSYEDVGDKDVPVVPQSHCWTFNSVLYCGCKEGQMFSVDIDIGSSHLLINPVSVVEADGGDMDSVVMPIIPEELSQLENQPVRSPSAGVKPLTAVGSDTLLLDTDDTSVAKSKVLPGKGDYSSMTYISKLGLYTAGENGIMYCVDVKGDQVEGKASLSVSQPVSHLASSLDNAKLIVATETGSTFVVETDGFGSTVPLFEQDQTSFVGIDCTVGGEYAVSCKASGRVQVWSLESSTMISTICLMEECCSVTCLPMCSAVAIGTKSGYLLMVSLLQPDSPALVSKQRLYYTALSKICCDTGGKCLALVSSNNDILIVSGKPSEAFQVLGHTSLEGYAQNISVQVETSIITVCVATSEASDSYINQLLLFSLPSPIKDEAYADYTRKFRDESINKRIIALNDVVTAFVLAAGSVGYGLLANTKELAKFTISSDKEISAEAVYTGHQLRGGCLSLSPHQKWLLCAAPDGAVSIRLVTSPDRFVTFTPHHYQFGGCQYACFSADGQRIITVGDGRTITCWEWRFSSHGKQKGIIAAEFAEKKLSALEPSIEKQNEALATYSVIETAQNISRDGEPPLDDEKTWLDKIIEEAKREDDKKYAAIQDSLRNEIQQLRDKVLHLIKTNETLPDIEKLDRSEFILDLEEHQKHQNEEAELIAKVREEVDMEILAQKYLRELIKQECWDSMAVKGKVLKAFQLRIEVSNYPAQKRPQQEIQQLNRVTQLRKVEVAESKTRATYIPKIEATTQHSKIDDEYADDDLGADLSQQEEEGDKDPEAFVGSRGSQFGGESTLLYDQFHLHSNQRKNHQLILLKDCVYRIKEKFNQEFEEVFQAKVSEIQHIREKNVRIKKIINDLKLTDEKVHEPELDEDEQPQSLLMVKDEEVTVEKYYSPEEKQKMEEAAKLEEERRKAELGDNPRERALNMMMGGRLEASAEEDLFKDFPRPEFMNKDPAEMSEDEIRLAREFEKKEAAFLEEREKLKKVLEGELKKLQASIEQSMLSFDDRLVKLFKLKLKTELAINQEELKILRLASSLLTEEEVNYKEELLNQNLVEYKNQKVQLNNTISVAKKQVEDFKRDYEYAVVDDKDLDRTFRKDFSDCDPYVDVLYKAFRKRPRGQRIKVGDSGYNLPVGQDHRSLLTTQHSHPGDIMAEYDSPSHMPEGVTHNMWERLVTARRKKVENEQKVKAMALQLAEMQSFLQNRTAEDEYAQQQIQETFKELSKLREDRNQFALNLELQLLLRQGQVELEPGQLVPDFSQSVLLHRNIIEQLNTQIKGLGEAKLSSMNECKEFKRGIHMLDWEHEKLKMEAEDLMMRTRDIQMLHVTKELQQWLIDEEQGGSKSRNTVDVLEKTLEINNQMHARMMRHQQRTLKKLQNSIAEKKEENQELDKQLKELQVSVIERQQIDELAGISQAEAGAKERMHNIIVRKKLVQAAKAQAQEIAILRAEVERLRMRTFPALVQAGN